MKKFSRFFSCVFFLFCVSSQAETDGELLMLAARLSYMKAIQARCESIIPGYASEFDAAYAAAKENVFDKVGLTDAVFAEASSFRELAIAPLVEQFDKHELATKRQFCNLNLQTIKDAAVAKDDSTR